MTTTELFHTIATEGDKITSMRYSKPEYRLMSAYRLSLIVRLNEIMEAFYKPIQTIK